MVRPQDDDLFVTSWGDWSLEPVGAALPRRVQTASLNAWIAGLKKQRLDIPEGYSATHIRLASLCFDLERAIAREKFNQGLKLVHRILANPVVTDHFAEQGLANGSKLKSVTK